MLLFILFLANVQHFSQSSQLNIIWKFLVVGESLFVGLAYCGNGNGHVDKVNLHNT